MKLNNFFKKHNIAIIILLMISYFLLFVAIDRKVSTSEGVWIKGWQTNWNRTDLPYKKLEIAETFMVEGEARSLNESKEWELIEYTEVWFNKGHTLNLYEVDSTGGDKCWGVELEARLEHLLFWKIRLFITTEDYNKCKVLTNYRFLP